MSIELDKPVWTCDGYEVQNLRRTGLGGDQELEGAVVTSEGSYRDTWTKDGFYFQNMHIGLKNLTNTPPSKSGLTTSPLNLTNTPRENPPAQPVPDELTTLRAENEHLKREVMRVHNEYRVLWKILNETGIAVVTTETKAE